MGPVVRTFVALALSEGLQAALRRWLGRLRSDAPAVRWVNPSLLHVTLAFLGDVPETDIDGVSRAVAAAAAAHHPLSLDLAGLGAFPTPARARVIWTGLVGPELPALLNLQRDVAAAVAGAGYPAVGGDRFQPHLTLGRVKGRQGRPGFLNVQALIDEHRSWRGGLLEVDELIVYASSLAKTGPSYTALAHAPLAATG